MKLSTRPMRPSTKNILDSIRDSRIVKKLDSAVFVELPAFQRHRHTYLDEQAFLALQLELLNNPGAGALIQGTGGLRKLRMADAGRSKGKRSGIRIIYYWCDALTQFWLFTLYDKDETDDLTAVQKSALKLRLAEQVSGRINNVGSKLAEGKHE